ncbi:MAG: hypothetical protein OXD44_06820 [Gammaproteobacteria bacterium]|nr:hypothetical protein [Gammaproteobacteria bacterium]MCY4227381.1 hypothetical protein [Gammaproteobacteria bacterium]MCY4313392.1 hypothetical protein [Gammaproteobacteria bacterium]
MDTLENRFIELWCAHSKSPNRQSAKEVHQGLVEYYNEDWRRYHTFEHIRDTLRWLDDCREHADDSDAIEMAIWFHDCIYVIGASDNEAQSRDYFLAVSEGVLDDSFRVRVAHLVMDTCHNEKPDSSDGELIADIDLTSFGLIWEDYYSDSINVQKECSIHKPITFESKTFYLNKLKQRKTIYYSDYYLNHYEASAQHNIAVHLDQITREYQERGTVS